MLDGAIFVDIREGQWQCLSARRQAATPPRPSCRKAGFVNLKRDLTVGLSRSLSLSETRLIPAGVRNDVRQLKQKKDSFSWGSMPVRIPLMLVLEEGKGKGKRKKEKGKRKRKKEKGKRKKEK